MHVLVCKDDELIASGIVSGITTQGMKVEHVNTTGKVRSILKAASFDAIVLNLSLPAKDSLKLLQ